MGKCMICKTVNQKNCGRTFHKFPHRDANLLQKWVENINKGRPGNCKPGKDSLLCSEHFKETCFDRTGFRVHLNKNSVPTIFSEAHCSACKKKKSQWPELAFHKFPVRNPKLLQQWVDKITFDLPTGIKNSLVCSDHFEKSCLVKSGGKIRLKKDSIPTQFETSEKRKALDEIDDDAASDEPSLDSIRSKPKRIKLHIIDDYTLERSELNTAIVSDSLEIISTPETCDLTVDSNISETDRDKNISVTPESENSHQLDFADIDHEQSTTGTPNSKQDHTSEIATPKTCARLFAHDHHYFDSPNTLRSKLATARKALAEKKKIIQSQQKRLKRMRRKITSLQQVVSDLRAKKLVSENAISCLDSISDTGVKEFITRTNMNADGKVTRMKYPPSLRSFALTLHFYSPKAYEYVRKKFNLALPHASVLRSWYSTIDGEPGFTEESFTCLKEKVDSEKSKNRRLLCALMLDEIGIKKGTQRSRDGKVRGHVDFGTELQQDDHIKEAKDGLVLMVVSLDSRWKIPIGYFLTNGIIAETSANLLTTALVKLHEIGVEVVSLTLDGPSEHFATVKLLGADFSIPDPRPFFSHPVTKSLVFVLFDPCHMLKLIRNCLGDDKIIIDGQGRHIEWKFITELAKVQDDEGLRAGTKLRLTHIRYFKQKMKVRLAAQTISQSVADAIEFCWQVLHLPNFKGCEATVEFLRSIDILFDFQNSRNPFAKGFKAPLKKANEHLWRPRINEKLAYLLNLKDYKTGKVMYTAPRKVGFVGIYTGAIAIMNIYDLYVKPDDAQMKYLLTYKMSQDHLELFFCAVRSCGGWCSNPTCAQFISAYKRLLIRHEIEATYGNSTAMDSTKILSVSSKSNRARPISHGASVHSAASDARICKKYDLDYTRDSDEDLIREFIKFRWQLPEKLSDFSVNSVSYIAGYVVRKLLRRLKCDHCRISLIYRPSEEELMNPPKNLRLALLKNRGGLTLPSQSVIHITCVTEKMFRHAVNYNEGHPPIEHQFPAVLCSQVMHKLLEDSPTQTLFEELNSHIFDESPEELSNHLYQLAKSVIMSYIDLRMFALTKITSLRQTGENIRHHLGRQVIWAHQ